MAANMARCIFLDSKVNIISKSFFSTSSILSVKTRTRRDVARNKTPEYVKKEEYYYQEHPSTEWTDIPEDRGPFKAGPLRDRSDYSFVDGRTVPLTSIQKKKLEQQMMFCEKIVNLSKEMDLAKEIYQQQVKHQQDVINQRLASKLKPKGLELLKSKRAEELKSKNKTDAKKL